MSQKIVLIYHFEISLAAGFALLDNEKEHRLHRGKRISACSGWALFSTLRNHTIQCWECGCTADRWVADKGRSDHQGPPVLNLYGTRADGCVILMTRDHIIPRSLGGANATDNLRPACEICNGARGNQVTAEDIAFKQANPHLISEKQFRSNMARVTQLSEFSADGEQMLAPYHAMLAANARFRALDSK